MAVETAPRLEAVTPGSNGHRPTPHLHSEILPPELGPATRTAQRTSRRSLWILAIGMIVVQAISTPVGHKLNSIARSGTDDFSIWQRYESSPVPDVLVIGASPARTDVHEPRLAAELSSAVGRPVTVEQMGFPGQNPLFLDALMYRIMKRTPHPKLIVITVVGPDLSNCAPCIVSVNGGLWEISDLTDPGFVRLALGASPDPGWLVAGWALPALAYYPSLIGVQCLAFDSGRNAAKATLGKVPQQLANPTACESLAAYKWGTQTSMTQLDYEGSLGVYRLGMSDYEVSPQIASRVADMVARARAGGSSVVFLQPPLHPGLRTRFPGEIQISHEGLTTLAGQLNAGVIDLTTAVPADPNLWVDGLHLDRAGADYFAPELARALAPQLGG